MGAAHNWLCNVVGIDSMTPRWAAWFAAQAERIAHDNSFADADAVFAAMAELMRYVDGDLAEAGRNLLESAAVEPSTVARPSRPHGVGGDAADATPDSPSQHSRVVFDAWSEMTRMLCDMQPDIKRARRIECAQTRAIARAAEQEAVQRDRAHLREIHDAPAGIATPREAIRIESLSLLEQQTLINARCSRATHKNKRERLRDNTKCDRAARRHWQRRGRLARVPYSSANYALAATCHGGSMTWRLIESPHSHDLATRTRVRSHSACCHLLMNSRFRPLARPPPSIAIRLKSPPRLCAPALSLADAM